MTLDLLGALLAGDPPPPEDGERHHVLFQPTFHHDALLTVDLAPVPAVHLRVFADSVWSTLTSNAELRDADTPEDLAVFVALVLPAYSDSAAALSSARAERLRDDLARALPGLAAPDDRCGRDGIGLDVAVRRGAAPPLRHSAWSPEPGMPAHAYFATMLDLASEVLHAHQALRCLAQLHGYLDIDLPMRDRGGAPRCLQIFGRLTSDHARGLAALFAGPTADEPVVVDMRYLETMSPSLFPLIRQFAGRPGPLVWAVSQVGRPHLRAAQVAENRLHHDLADAVLHVVTLAARR